MPSYFTLCVISIALGLMALAGISPLLWDAAGYVEDALMATYRIELTVKP